MCYWLVAQIDPKPSQKVKGSICYHLLFINLETRKTAKTYVEATYRNYANWQDIIEDQDHSYIVNNITFKHSRVNADSMPNIIISATHSAMRRELENHWLKPTKTTYGDLFE
jgi:hypothetical protein